MAEKIANLKDKLLGDKDAAFARANPKLFDGLTKIVSLLEDEQGKMTTGFEEIKEQAKIVSVKSMLQLRRTQALAFSRKKQSTDDITQQVLPQHTVSDMFKLDETFAPLKEETVGKQGKDQMWRDRHFVLRNEGVLYYDNVQSFRTNPQKPKGKIMFCDMICPSGQAADEVPRFIYLLLGRPFVFCLHSEENTFVVSCWSKEQLKSWVAAINSAFNTFILNQAKKAALMDAVWVVGSPDIWKTVNKLTTNNASMDQVLGELFLIMLDQFEQDVVEVRRAHEKRRLLQLWRDAIQNKKLQRMKQELYGVPTLQI